MVKSPAPKSTGLFPCHSLPYMTVFTSRCLVFVVERTDAVFVSVTFRGELAPNVVHLFLMFAFAFLVGYEPPIITIIVAEIREGVKVGVGSLSFMAPTPTLPVVVRTASAD